METPRIRRAEAADLPAAHDVSYENEVLGAPSPPPPGPVPPALRHVFEHGEMHVAERGGRLVRFAAAVHRGAVAYLSDLFVRPGEQSSGIGAALLRRGLPSNDRWRWTLASTDNRCLALYARAGMPPRWPNVELRAERTRARDLPASGLETVEGQPDDPALLEWDAEVGGRPRPQDHAFWVREQGGVPLWFARGREAVGYGYARPAIRTVWTPEKVVVGPIGCRSADDAAACVIAAATWARRHGPVLDVALPGPHPAPVPLLEAGFRIIYVDTFCASGGESAARSAPVRGVERRPVLARRFGQGAEPAILFFTPPGA